MSPHPLVDVWKTEDQNMAEINAVTVQSLIGARVLLGLGVSYNGTPTNLEEVTILEVSPAGSYVRLRNVHGSARWMRVAEVKLLERLVPLESDPARTMRKDVADRVVVLERKVDGLSASVELLRDTVAALEREAASSRGAR